MDGTSQKRWVAQSRNHGWHKPETVGGTISQWVAQSRNLGISWGAAAFAAVFCYTCLTELADETHQDELHQDELTCCRFMLAFRKGVRSQIGNLGKATVNSPCL